MSSSVTTLVAVGTSDLSLFTLVGLMDLASLALFHESSDGLFLCLCIMDQGSAAEVVPVLLRTGVVDVGVQGTSEVVDVLTEARDGAVVWRLAVSMVYSLCILRMMEYWPSFL
jgi:hypothetical protein